MCSYLSYSVLSCYLAFVPSCFRALVPSCYRAIVPSCFIAFVLSCPRALALSCYRALVPSCYRAIVVFGAYSIKKVLVKPIALDDSFNQLAYYRVLDSFYCCAVGANSCLFRGEMRCINLIVAEGVHGIAFPTGCIYL